MVLSVARSVSLEYEEKTRFIRQKLGVKPIVIIGMMGSGKTCVGAKLANQLGNLFFDSDKEIEKQANMTISEVFEVYGEPFFRRKEQEMIIDLIKRHSGVIATGGGAFMNKAVRDFCRGEALVLWLKTDKETLMKRLRLNQSRPLLQTDNPGQTLQNLLKEREPIYAQADIMVDTSQGSQKDNVRKIIDHLAAYFNNK